MDLKGTCQIVKMNSFSEEDQSYLHLLYYPLIHSEAITVYEILLSLANRKEKYDHTFLINLTFFPEAKFERARKMLENFNLLMTYYEPATKNWVYQLYPPLNANEFLTHDTFSRLYLKEMGSKHFDRMKVLFHTDFMDTTNMVNVSSSLDLSKLDSWDDSNEELYKKLRPKTEDVLKKYPFDFGRFLDGMDRTFPQRIRSSQNLERIAQLATIYGVDEKKMRGFVLRSLEDDKSRINFEKLRERVINSVNEIKDEGRSMAPVKYFALKQKGIPVNRTDKAIIESLCTDYGFSFEVVNVLIDYILRSANQQFPRALVEKVASTWVRLGIDTEEKALEESRNIKYYNNSGSNMKKVIDFSPTFNQEDEYKDKDVDELLKLALEAQASIKED